jgi:hypothetical protein
MVLDLDMYRYIGGEEKKKRKKKKKKTSQLFPMVEYNARDTGHLITKTLVSDGWICV